jgi:ADP-ribose pyrophosphatase YjhB (NUDIX family)
MNNIRSCAKAIIIRDGSILAIKYVDAERDYFALPGGAQVHGETLNETLIRECREELGVKVNDKGLRFIRECIYKVTDPTQTEIELHQIEFIFECSIEGNVEPIMGIHHDYGQVDVAWLPLDQLHTDIYYPKKLIEYLDEPLPDVIEYWGLVD